LFCLFFFSAIAMSEARSKYDPLLKVLIRKGIITEQEAAEIQEEAREIEKGTVFLLLARPFPRYHLVLAKGAALLVGLIALVGAALAGTALGITITDLDQPVRLSRFLLVSSNALLLFLAIGGYGFL